MIEGQINQSGNTVTLTILATVTIAGTSAEVDFLIDTGAYATVIYPKDQDAFLSENPAAFQSAPEISARGVGGTATFRLIPGTLTFYDTETAAPWQYPTQIYIAETEPDTENGEPPQFPSLLGMDILRHWIPQGIHPSRPAIQFTPKAP